jgi:hypothetical protein
MLLRRLITAALAFPLLSLAAAAEGATFRVTLAPAARKEAAHGRLIVFLVREGSKVPKDAEPVDGPFWDDPQPLFGRDAEIHPGEAALVDDAADAFPSKASQLAPGSYRAQARFDLARLDSDWRREPGNLWSDTVAFTVEKGGKTQPVELVLTHVVEKRAAARGRGRRVVRAALGAPLEVPRA